MKHIRNKLALLLVVLSALTTTTRAQRAPVTPADCVKVRYPASDAPNYMYGPVQPSPDGTKIAFLIKAPDLASNRDRYTLNVKPVTSADAEVTVSLSSEYLQHITWMNDGRHLVILRREGNVSAILLVDTQTSTTETITQQNGRIMEYTMAPLANTLVFTKEDPTVKAMSDKQNIQSAPSGFRIPWSTTIEQSNERERRLFIAHRSKDGHWTEKQWHASGDHGSIQESFPEATNLSLSPDGRMLAFAYYPEDPPAEWKSDPYGQRAVGMGGVISVSVVADLSSGALRTPIKSELQGVPVLWSRDSNHYLFVGAAPIGSDWEKEDLASGLPIYGNVHLFEVDVEGGGVSQIVDHLPNDHEAPLEWAEDGKVSILVTSGTIGTFSRLKGHWVEESRTSIPLANSYRYDSMIGLRGRIYGVHEAISTPPNIYMLDPRTRHIEFLTDLNPELNQLALVTPEKVEWKSTTGSPIQGFLWKPLNFVEGKRYPLVIETKGNQGRFACDSGFNHTPAFEPQPMASAGIMYLTRTFPEGFHQSKEDVLYAKQFPGGLSEAAIEMGVWEGAVNNLAARGWVDPNKVGIIGFSRTGWQVEFDLANSSVHYAAATAADNIQYSLGEYWGGRSPTTADIYDRMYGGSPYGKGRENWIKYSISFNVDKIHTPLLMETMGNGAADASMAPYSSNLFPPSEVFAALNRLGTPVEWYYYPDEPHEPEHPEARLASLQRNLDWYRFWLQGYERPTPEDPAQFARWEHLRSNTARRSQ